MRIAVFLFSLIGGPLWGQSGPLIVTDQDGSYRGQFLDAGDPVALLLNAKAGSLAQNLSDFGVSSLTPYADAGKVALWADALAEQRGVPCVWLVGGMIARTAVAARPHVYCGIITTDGKDRFFGNTPSEALVPGDDTVKAAAIAGFIAVTGW